MQKKPRNTLENYHEAKLYEEIFKRFIERKRKEFIFVSIFAVFVLTIMSIWFLYLDSKPDGYIAPFEIRYEETGENNSFVVMCEYEYLLIGTGDDAHEVQLNSFAANTAAKNFKYFLLPQKPEADIEHLFFYRNFRVQNIILPWSVKAETPTDYIVQTFDEAKNSSFLHYDFCGEYDLGQAKFYIEPSDSGLSVRVIYLGNEFLISGNRIEVVKGDVREKFRVIDTDENKDLVIRIRDGELKVEKEKER